MKVKIRQEPFFFAAFVLIFFVLWLLANFHGLGLTDDSLYYINLFAEDKAILKRQRLYPYLLSLSGNPQRLGLWLNGFGIIGSLVIWAHIFHQADLEKSVKRFGFGLLALGVPHILVSSFLWTETLFIFFSSLAFWLYIQWQEHSIPAALIGFLLALLLTLWTRKVGYVLIGAGIISLFTHELGRKKWSVISYFVFAVGVAVYWLYFFEGEKPEWAYVLRNLRYNSDALISWFIPDTAPQVSRVFFGLFILASLLIIKPGYHPLTRFFWTYFVLYFLIRLPIDREFPEEAHRYFAILYAPAIFVFMHHWQALKNQTPLLRRSIYLLIIGLLVIAAARTMYNSFRWYDTRAPQNESAIHAPH